MDNNKGGTRGSLYVDFTNERKNVGLCPMPTVPDAVQELMNEANMFAMPPQPLVLSKQEGNIRNRLLDRLCADVTKLGRPVAEKSNCKIDIYIAPHQLEASLCNGLFEDIKDKLERVWKVDYKREAVTDMYHGYRLTVNVKVDN